MRTCRRMIVAGFSLAMAAILAAVLTMGRGYCSCAAWLR